MKIVLRGLAVSLVVSIFLSIQVHAADGGRKILMGGCGLGRIVLFDRDNTVLWEMKEPREVSDLWILANSNIVHSTKHGLREIKPDYGTGMGGEVIWEVNAPEGSECHSCQPIGDDRYLVGYSSAQRSYLAEIDSKGREYKVVEVEGQRGKHSSFRQVRKTEAGSYITSQQSKGGRAREYSADGKLLRTFPSGHYSAVRLENGNTLLGCGDEHRLIEVDKSNKIVWELKQDDIPGVKFGFIAGIWVLEDGNILISNWGGHSGSTGGAVLEINRDKKLIFSTDSAIKNRVSSLYVVE